ncbi:hypothetical protein ANN_18122 [Periplaneta americana]|uniref:Uncharacterized protein n=1 Tax=Periplaneta americana TaxID=6978 RepID=A0ABQ8SMV1_PERAM|nr:hypothetical protein ANN_18122 [Periplaneta americana]
MAGLCEGGNEPPGSLKAMPRNFELFQSFKMRMSAMVEQLISFQLHSRYPALKPASSNGDSRVRFQLFEMDKHKYVTELTTLLGPEIYYPDDG